MEVHFPITLAVGAAALAWGGWGGTGGRTAALQMAVGQLGGNAAETAVFVQEKR